MTKPNEPPTIEVVPVHVALSRIMAELPAIGKDDRMAGGGMSYNYRGIEAITAHVQPLLAKHGVIIIPKTTVTGIEPALDAKPGWQDAVISIDWLIVGPDGSTLEARTVGIGRDSSDKSCTKAASQAFKYLLLHLFCISDRSDDSDGLVDDSAREQVDDGPTPIQQLYADVKASKGTALAVELKTLADFNQHKLSEKDFAEFPIWFELVAATISDYQTRETHDA